MKIRCLLFALCCAFSAQAQRLTGHLESPSREPVAYATVVLLREGVQAAGATTDSLGRFALAATPGVYRLQARHLAYRPLEREVSVTATMNLGAVQVEEATTAVDDVVVRATAITRQADRFVVSVGDLPALAGKDGAELLAQAPGVWLDDEGVAINGMKGVKVFVNDRELRLTGDKLTTYLRGLTSTDIARIEVIPQAGAEYGADARGGVLRIVLRRRSENGMNGSFTVTSSQSSRLEGYAPSGNLNLRTGRWTLTAAGTGVFIPRATGHFDETRDYNTDAQQFAGRSAFDTQSRYGSGRVGIFFDPAPRHALGIEAEYASTHREAPSEASTTIAQYGLQTLTESRYGQRSNEASFSATFNYMYKLDTLGSSLKFLADYTRQRDRGDNDYSTHFSAYDFSRDTLYRSTTAARYDIFSSEVALKKGLGRAMKLRSGLKYTRNRLSDEALYEGHGGAEWVVRPEYNYALAYTEQIAAAYLSLSADVGRWSLSAGLRGEYTATDGRQSKVQKSYFGLFPSASATYAFNVLRTWMLSAQYSRNIERPGFHALNPARIQFSDYSYQIGNPALRPIYINRFSLTVIWKYRYTLTIGGNLHSDLIREVCKTDPEDSAVSYITPENHYRENHWFAALSAPVQLARRWSLNVNLVGVRQDIRLTRQSGKLGNWLLFANATTGLTLPAKFYAEATYAYNSRLYSGNSEVAPRHTLSVTLKKRLCKDRLSLSLSVQNLFDAPQSYISRTGEFVRATDGVTALSARYCKIGITWTFRSGREVKARQAESTATAERLRLKKPEQQQ